MQIKSIRCFSNDFSNEGCETTLTIRQEKAISQKTYQKVFGCRIPDTDTSDLLIRYLPIDILEKIKQSVVQKLLRYNTFSGWRTQCNRYCIAVDATGIHTFKTEPYPNCYYKDSKKVIRTYSSSVMEAKLLCPNGFSICIMTEWIINDPDNTKNNKQDCEQKAFIRLSKNLKIQFSNYETLF